MPSHILRDFTDMLLDAGPAFAVALVLAAGAIVWTRRSQRLQTLLQRIGSSLPLAALAGGILPGCALSTLPLAFVLRQHGARVGTLTAFMVTSAVLGPSSIILTALLLDWQLTLMRIFLPLGAVLVLGSLMNLFAGQRLFSLPPVAKTELATAHPVTAPATASCCTFSHLENSDGSQEHLHSAPEGLSRPETKPFIPSGHDHGHHGHHHHPDSFGATILAMSRTLIPLLVVGLLAASMIRHWVPSEWIENSLQHGGFAYLIAVGAGIPAYVCEGGEVPLTLALLNLGVGPGPAFTFMLSAVGTCLPTLLVAPRIIGKGATAAYASFWVIFTIGAGLLVAALYTPLN